MTQQALYEFSNEHRSLEIDYAVRNPALQALVKQEMQDLLNAPTIARINNIKNEAAVEVAPKVMTKETSVALPTNAFDAQYPMEVTAFPTQNPALQAVLNQELSELYAQKHVQQQQKEQPKDVAMNDIVPFLRIQQERSTSQDKGFSIV
jgi:hypothetical protein